MTLLQTSRQNLVTFPNLVFDPKSVNSTQENLNFSTASSKKNFFLREIVKLESAYFYQDLSNPDKKLIQVPQRSPPRKTNATNHPQIIASPQKDTINKFSVLI